MCKISHQCCSALPANEPMTSIYTRNSQSTSNESFAELSKKLTTLGADLQSRIVSLQANIESSAERDVSHSSMTVFNQYLIIKLDNAVKSAQNVVPLASLNAHFYTPQSVSSIFTGRTSDLNTLRQCLLDSKSTNKLHQQKRFVVYGLPGSGKTQFCCKFASDNKQK